MIKIKDKKEFVNILAITAMFAITIVFFFVYVVTYFNGYYLTISINDYGEANVEVILFSIITILGLYSLKFNLRRMKNL